MESEPTDVEFTKEPRLKLTGALYQPNKNFYGPKIEICLP